MIFFWRSHGEDCHQSPEAARGFTPVDELERVDAPTVVELTQNQICKALREVGRVMRTVALCETAGLGWSAMQAGVIAAISRTVAIGDLSVAAGISGTHLAPWFKELIGVTPKRLARTYRFAVREHPGHVMDGWPWPAD